VTYLDPFCGSGMTGLAALRLGRNIILNDLSPAATHIAYNYCMPIKVGALREEFERIRASVRDEFARLYRTVCSRCGGPAKFSIRFGAMPFECKGCSGEILLWNVAVDHMSGQVHESFNCPHCGRLQKKLASSD